MTGLCHGALFQGLDPLPNEDEFLGGSDHQFVHQDHVVEMLKRSRMEEFARVPRDAEWGPGGPPHPAEWACSESTGFLPKDLAVSLDTLNEWVEEERPGGVLWDRETGLTGPGPIP